MASLAQRKFISRIMTGLTALCAVLVIVALFAILAYILIGGVRYLSLDFLVNDPKPVGEAHSGIRNAIVGSAILVAVGSVIGIPIGVLGGLFLAETEAHKLASIIRFLIDNLIGVPSIIIGVFAWTAIVKPTGHFSGWAGGLALAMMMAPIVARTTEEMIKLVPMELREAALALGAPRWRVSLGVVLRTAAGGIGTGCMLAIARVAGETAPLLFTALGLGYLNTNLNQPMASLTYQIYYYATSPYEDWHAMAWSATLVLITMIFMLNIAVKFILRSKHS
ncbi:MAG TPA: phosphate ABC transporter permease PstA [Blastocatellia bacterium]|nr:phosphate ABC transporter permease PstA [Blastocatellia bacterium]